MGSPRGTRPQEIKILFPSAPPLVAAVRNGNRAEGGGQSPDASRPNRSSPFPLLLTLLLKSTFPSFLPRPVPRPPAAQRSWASESLRTFTTHDVFLSLLGPEWWCWASAPPNLYAETQSQLQSRRRLPKVLSHAGDHTGPPPKAAPPVVNQSETTSLDEQRRRTTKFSGGRRALPIQDAGRSLFFVKIPRRTFPQLRTLGWVLEPPETATSPPPLPAGNEKDAHHGSPPDKPAFPHICTLFFSNHQ